jgi:predicted transcriptional regulator
MSVKLIVTMNKELKNKIEEMAKRKNISQSALISLLVSEYFEREASNDKN